MNDLSSVTLQFTAAQAPRVSVVLPLHNAGPAIADRIAEVAVDAELARINLVEIIAVDDGSSDLTWSALEAEAVYEKRLRPIRLRRRFGHAAACEAGVLAATGDIVITLEADAPAADLGKLVAMIEAGRDVVVGWRGDRHAKPSGLVWRATGLNLRNPFGATLACRRDVLSTLLECGAPLSSLPLVARSLGYRVGEVRISAPVRRGRVETLIGFAELCSMSVRIHASERWLGLAILVGTALMAAAFILPTALLSLGLAFGISFSPLSLLVTGLAMFLCGFQLTGLAMLGSMAQCGKGRASGRIAETLPLPDVGD